MGLSKAENERIRDAMRDYIKAHDITQVALAERIGVDQSMVSGFLGGRQGTSFQVAIAFANLAKVPLRSLIDLPISTFAPEAELTDAVQLAVTLALLCGATRDVVEEQLYVSRSMDAAHFAAYLVDVTKARALKFEPREE